MLHPDSNYFTMSPLGRGIEYANARSKHIFRNRCTHSIQEMESEIRYSFSLAVQPDSLTCKYERRVRDHMRSYRIGIMTTDLEKMSKIIKTHRNMLDSYQSFVLSDIADDETDSNINRDPEKIIAAFEKLIPASK